MGCRYFCLSDFIAPKETGLPDYLGLFVNTAGLGLEKLTEKYKADQVRARQRALLGRCLLCAECVDLSGSTDRRFWSHRPCV